MKELGSEVAGGSESPYKSNQRPKIQICERRDLLRVSNQVNKDEYNKDKKFSPKITSPALEFTNTQDGNIGLHLQVLSGGTHLNGVGSELTIFMFAQISFCYSWFRLQLITIHCVDRTPSHETFSRHFHPCAHITLWLKVSHDVSA